MSAIPPLLLAGDCISRTVLPARRRPKSYPDLVPKLEPVLAEWIKSAADWPDLGLGQAKVLVFETPLPGGATFFVRFWSEPRTPLLCEIPSGIQDDALRAWFTAKAPHWAEQNKMTISGAAKNFRTRIPAHTELQISVAALFVLEAFVECVDYAGLTPIIATLAHEDRSDFASTLDCFTEEEVARVFQSLGFRITPSLPDPDNEIDEPAFSCTKAGVETIVTMMDPVPGHRLWRRVRFDADLPATEKELERSLNRGEIVTGDMTIVSISGIHAFTGGVTSDWLVERVRDWDSALKEHRREMRREGKRKRAAPPTASPPETIH